MNFRSSFPVFRAVALSAACLCLIPATACMDNDPSLQGSFAEQSREPTGVKMPKFDSPDLPSAVVPTQKSKAPDSLDPCALNATTLAACIPLTTALATTGPSTSVVATDNGDLFLVQPGVAPVHVANVGTAVQQILPSESVTEDGQFFVLRRDSTIARVTLLPDQPVGAASAEIREMPELNEIGIVAIYFRDGDIQKLLSGDPGVVLNSVCHGPQNMPLLATATLDGVPQLVQWIDGWIEPLGGVDLTNDIAGCTVVGDQVAVAIPEAEKVLSVPIRPTAEKVWEISGAPQTLVDGEFGRVSHLTTVAGTQAIELWGATTNKALGNPGGASDERVIRLPSHGSAGAAPD